MMKRAAASSWITEGGKPQRSGVRHSDLSEGGAVPRATTRFMDVLAGNIPFKAFFNPASIARLMV
jgi:hypothetical protein